MAEHRCDKNLIAANKIAPSPENGWTERFFLGITRTVMFKYSWIRRSLVVLLLCLAAACTNTRPTKSSDPDSPSNTPDTEEPSSIPVPDAPKDPQTPNDPGVQPDPDPFPEPDPEPDPEPEPFTGAIRYPKDRWVSPLSASVIAAVNTMKNAHPERFDNSFMKIGASSTAGSGWLKCFDGDEMLGNNAALQPTVDYFSDRTFSGETSYTRDTEAAKSGVSAGWPLSGSPSPVDAEIAVMNPRFAFVNYGTNDMGLGSTYQSALWGFGEKQWDLIDYVMAEGMIPLVTASIHHGNAARSAWVETFNIVSRGIAQHHQVPYIDLFAAGETIPNNGLSGDGIHANRHPDGACLLSNEGLEYGFNIRNLLSLQALDHMRAALENAAPEVEVEAAVQSGDGRLNSPWATSVLPFTHISSTQSAGTSDWDSYGCSPGTDESGPELHYEFTLFEDTALRLFVLDRDNTDVDIHLLSAADPSACLARAHRMIQGTLAAGTYRVAVDSWVNSSGTELSGEYLFAMLECAPDDPDCDDTL